MSLDKIYYSISTSKIPYEKALEFMELRLKQVQNNTASQLIWFLEHEDVYTAGTSANDEELIKPDKFPVFKTGRGGKYTYHGPGQRVIYLILDVKKLYNDKPDIKDFIKKLELWAIKSFEKIGIEAHLSNNGVGVWVKSGQDREEKIAALGIRLKRWVSYHGIAINVDPDLSHYDGIIPCGIKDKGVTSIRKLGKKTTLKDFDDILISEFKNIFGSKLFKSKDIKF